MSLSQDLISFFGRNWKKLINLISSSRMLILCCGSYVATFSMIRMVTHTAHAASIFQDNIIKSSSLEIYQMETGDNRKSVKTFPTFVYVYSVDWRWRWRLYWVVSPNQLSIGIGMWITVKNVYNLNPPHEKLNNILEQRWCNIFIICQIYYTYYTIIIFWYFLELKGPDILKVWCFHIFSIYQI